MSVQVNSDVAVEVRDVHKSFGPAPAVDGVSFRVERGEALAIIGPNGAGKSTLFGVVAGEHRPDSGHVLLHGRDVTRRSPGQRCRAGLGRTFQVASFFASRTVRENVQIAWASRRGRLSSLDRFASGGNERDKRVDEVLDMLDLGHLAGVESRVLAQGDRKRLELAMALAPDPQVLLLDEPTAGMSNADIERTIALLRQIKQDNDALTVVLTAHDMDVVFGVAGRVILMGQGRLLVDGTPAEVESHPTTRTLYLGSEVPTP